MLPDSDSRLTKSVALNAHYSSLIHKHTYQQGRFDPTIVVAILKTD